MRSIDDPNPMIYSDSIVADTWNGPYPLLTGLLCGILIGWAARDLRPKSGDGGDTECDHVASDHRES